MTIHKWTAVATILLAMMCVASTPAQQAGAPIYDYTAVEAQTAVLDRMEELEAEVASLRSQLLGGGDCAGCDGKGCGSCGKDGGKVYDACGPTWEFWTDATLLRFHKTGGVQTGSDAFSNRNPETIELGFITSPRVHLRYYQPSGLFIEGTFFQFNHSTVLGPDSIQVNTYTFDVKFGEKFQLNENWWLEWTGGPRRFRYEETLIDGDEGEANFTKFDGVGGVVSLAVGRPISRGFFSRLLNMDQSLYGGAVFAIAHGDLVIRENRGVPTAVRLADVNSIHLEIATGTEWTKTFENGSELFIRWGVEWVTFTDASTQFNGTAPGRAGHEDDVAPGADVGFGGFTASLGLRW